MSVIPFPAARPAARPVPRPVGRAPAPKPALSLLAVWRSRLDERRILASLDEEQLRDAGLDPFQVYLESVKPFWRA